MATFKRFEDIAAWQQARALTKRIYEVTKSRSFSRDFGLRDQIQRASTSIMNNIAEGFERNSNAEFSRFLMIAKGSAGEVRSQLYVALDQNYVAEAAFQEMYAEADKIGRMIGSLMEYLQRSELRGSRYKRPREER